MQEVVDRPDTSDPNQGNRRVEKELSDLGEDMQAELARVVDLMKKHSTYALKLPDEFKVIPGYNFWILKDGKYVKISNAQSLSKLFPEQKDILKNFARDNHTDFSSQSDVLQLVKQVHPEVQQ